MPLTATDIDATQHATTTVKAQPPVAAHFAAAKAASNDADKVRRPYTLHSCISRANGRCLSAAFSVGSLLVLCPASVEGMTVAFYRHAPPLKMALARPAAPTPLPLKPGPTLSMPPPLTFPAWSLPRLPSRLQMTLIRLLKHPAALMTIPPVFA
jgi:hypothetical protein